MIFTGNKIYDSRQEFDDRKARYEKNGMPYTLRTTTNSSEIRSDQMRRTYISTNKQLHLKDRNFIGRVISDIRRRIASNAITIPSIDPPSYNFCQINTSAQYFTDVIEIDINAAYWNSAYMQGIISKTTYDSAFGDNTKVRLSDNFIKEKFPSISNDRYFDIASKKGKIVTIKIKDREVVLYPTQYHYKYKPAKEVRLIPLGALAKQTTCFYFDGHSLRQTSIEKPDEIEARLWKMICYKVFNLFDNIMKVIPEEDFILYWVDALVIKKSSKETVSKMIEEAGFTYKEKNILGVQIGQGSIRIKDFGNKERIFKFKTK